MKAKELMERYESLEESYSEIENEVRMEEAVLKVTKENIKKSGKELEEHGISFKNLTELKKVEKEYEDRIEKQLEKMEEILGVDEEDDLEYMID